MRPRDRPKSVYTVNGVCYFKPNEFKHLCDLVGIVRHWCCIWHDHDLNDDGSPKVSHLHFIVTLFYQHSLTSFKKKFQFYINKLKDDNTTLLVEATENVKSSFDYLTHKYEIDKFLYRETDIFSDDINRWKNTRDGNKNEEFFRDIGQLSRVQMCYKYGRDYMKNYKVYEEFYREAVWEEEHTLYDESLRKEESKIFNRSQEYHFDFKKF